MPGQTAAVHGVRCSGRTFAQCFPLRNGIFPHVPEISGQSGNGEIFAALLFLGAEAWRLTRPWIMEGLPFLRVLSSSCGGLPLGGEAVQGGIFRPPVGRQEIGTGSLSEEMGLSGNLKADSSPPDEKGDGWWPVRSV